MHSTDYFQTSLLMAILGELPLSNGKIKIQGKLAYVAQESWVFAGSVRQNILFGQPYDKEFYLKVLQACALDKVCNFFLFKYPVLTYIG